MSQTPEPSAQPTSAAAAPPPPPPQRVKPPRLYTAAAWVVIVAGIVFILSVVFFSGALVFGHHYRCHHHHYGPMYTPGGPGPWQYGGPGGPGMIVPMSRGPGAARDDRPRWPGWAGRSGCRPRWSGRPQPDPQRSEPSPQHAGAAPLAGSRRMQRCLTFLDLFKKGRILGCVPFVSRTDQGSARLTGAGIRGSALRVLGAETDSIATISVCTSKALRA